MTAIERAEGFLIALDILVSPPSNKDTKSILGPLVAEHKAALDKIKELQGEVEDLEKKIY